MNTQGIRAAPTSVRNLGSFGGSLRLDFQFSGAAVACTACMGCAIVCLFTAGMAHSCKTRCESGLQKPWRIRLRCARCLCASLLGAARFRLH